MIPVIDLWDDRTDEADLARVLVDAAAEYGFVYIRNTGKDISPDQMEKVWGASRALFASPIEEKRKCAIQPNNKGWSGMHSETLDPKAQRIGDFKEAFNFGKFQNNKSLHPIPSSMIPHEASIAEFKSSCQVLCQKLLLLFGIGLKVQPPDFFAAACADQSSAGTTLRFLYYPPPSSTSAARGEFGAGAHSDYGAMTLLFRIPGQGGLEILTPDDKWEHVPVVPPGTENDPCPPTLINIGDLLSYWTNGLLKSTYHRVVFDNGTVDGESVANPRYSIAFFYHPAKETRLGVVPSERVINHRMKTDARSKLNEYSERTVVTADEHLQMRLRDTYLDGAFRQEKVTT